MTLRAKVASASVRHMGGLMRNTCGNRMIHARALGVAKNWPSYVAIEASFPQQHSIILTVLPNLVDLGWRQGLSGLL